MDGLDVTPLASIEQVGAVEVRADPGHVPLPLHSRAGRSEAFFLLEGELTFRLPTGEHRIEPETWVFLPPAVERELAVAGNAPARFLAIHIESSGLDTRSLVRRAGGSEGEKISDRPGRRATVLVDADDLIVSEFAYGPGERGAEPHVHQLHADGFLVVEGEFTFVLRDGPVAISTGGLVLVPPDAVHGFANDSDALARCFNFHAPSSGFGDYLRGRNPDFDQHDPPTDGGGDTPSVVIVRLSR